MGREGDKKAFVGHDHGQAVEGTDGKEPTTEKQWRDMPKGSRPAKPAEQHEEPKQETQKATGNNLSRYRHLAPRNVYLGKLTFLLLIRRAQAW